MSSEIKKKIVLLSDIIFHGFSLFLRLFVYIFIRFCPSIVLHPSCAKENMHPRVAENKCDFFLLFHLCCWKCMLYVLCTLFFPNGSRKNEQGCYCRGNCMRAFLYLCSPKMFAFILSASLYFRSCFSLSFSFSSARIIPSFRKWDTETCEGVRACARKSMCVQCIRCFDSYKNVKQIFI